MTKLLAALAALAAAVQSGCLAPIGCGGGDDVPDSVVGEWAIQRMITSASPCPTLIDRELAIYIDEAGEVTVLSNDHELYDHRVWRDGDRQFVELTVGESWLYTGAEPGTISAALTYQLELVPVTGRLEGSATFSYFFDTTETSTTCTGAGAASGGFVASA